MMLMTDKSQLHYLLQLLEDDSPKVRAKIVEKLRAFGPELEPELLRQGLEMEPEHWKLLREPHRAPKPSEFVKRWLQCLELPSDATQIEAAFALIAEYQDGRASGPRLAALLDVLASDFVASGLHRDALGLCRFLFGVHGLQGAAGDYYNPRNSNLVHVILERRGIPISLACVFILVGKRMDITVQGCNVPHHFLVRAEVNGVDYIFDPFSGGKLVSPAQLDDLRRIAPKEFLETLDAPASARGILLRVLSNLIVAHQQAGEPEHTAFFQKVLLATRNHAGPQAQI